MKINKNLTIPGSPDIKKKGLPAEIALEPKDRFSKSKPEATCTLEIQQELNSLISKAYNAEDAVKAGIGFGVTLGTLGGTIGYVLAGEAIGAVAGPVVSKVGGVMGAVLGTALCGGYFGYTAKVSNDEYKKYVSQIREINEKYNCGLIEK